MVTLAETLRADEVLLTVHQVAENCMATIDRGFGRASAALNPARRDFARTLRWREMDSNLRSRSKDIDFEPRHRGCRRRADHRPAIWRPHHSRCRSRRRVSCLCAISKFYLRRAYGGSGP